MSGDTFRMSVCGAADHSIEFNDSGKLLLLANGSVASIRTTEGPRRLFGPFHDGAKFRSVHLDHSGERFVSVDENGTLQIRALSNGTAKRIGAPNRWKYASFVPDATEACH
jgi:hypothetical protein